MKVQVGTNPQVGPQGVLVLVAWLEATEVVRITQPVTLALTYLV